MSESNNRKLITSELKPIVFYDGGCSLCRREISHYQTMKGADAINWVNIDQHPELLVQFGISYRDAMQRLHVIDRNGRQQTGAYAFIVIWQNLVALKWISKAVEKLRLVGLVDKVYSAFAKWRFKRRSINGSCEIKTGT